MQDTKHDHIRQQVRIAYAQVAQTGSSCCATAPAQSGNCCAPSEQSVAELLSRGIGYSAEELAAAPEGANLGLGCGNPQAIAALKAGEIEHLPVADASVDVIISNCVINLSPDKAQVFHDAFRVLKPGGRLAISDIVLTAGLPAEMQAEAALHTACVAGAVSVDTLAAAMTAAGFTDIRIVPKDASREYVRHWAPGRGVEDYIASASIEAVKPE